MFFNVPYLLKMLTYLIKKLQKVVISTYSSKSHANKSISNVSEIFYFVHFFVAPEGVNSKQSSWQLKG